MKEKPIVLPPLPESCRLAVVIPCRNEAAYIEGCVRSILEADYPSELLSIRVVDGMSDDGTREILEALACQFQNVQFLDNPQRTTPVALNLGLRSGGYDAAIILGAHAKVDPGFLRRNVEVLRSDHTVGCSGGVIENVYESETARRIGAAMGHPFGVGSAHFRTGRREGYVDTVAFGCYRSEVFASVGYFDDELVRNQDDEFNYRVTQAGFRILLDLGIRSKYYVRASYPRLFEQYEQYGFWKVYVNRKHGVVTTLRQLVPAAWVGFVLLGLSLSSLNGAIAAAFLAGLALYMLIAWRSSAKVSASLAERYGVIQAFIVLHAGYGIGYLRGIWELLVLRRAPQTKDHVLTRGQEGTASSTLSSLMNGHGVFASLFLMGTFFCLSLWPAAMPVLLVLSGAALLGRHWRSRELPTISVTDPMLWMAMYYLAHAVGMAWSDDVSFGLFDLEVKVSLLIVPLLFWLVPRTSGAEGGILVGAFVAGTVVSLVVDILFAVARLPAACLSMDAPESWGSISVELFSSALSLYLHPSYAAMYALFALGWLQWKAQGHWTVHLLLITSVILLGSKVGWMVLVALLTIAIIHSGTRHLLPAALAILLALGYTATSPFMREKLQHARYMFAPTGPTVDATGSSEVRLLVWRAARRVAQEHWPWGTGTGDIKNDLVASYEKSGYVQPAALRLNAHSQFLQSTAALGVIGLVLLCALLALPLVQGVRDHRWPVVLLSALVAVQCAVESILEVQAGVLFVALLSFALQWDRRASRA
jgi:glycosyltransferase involved in cell wall biosynthesis/O-antigen ligase